MSQPLFSVVIPAHNEEQYIGKCLDAIAKAAAGYPCGTVETIVVLNRCNDQTEAIAREKGAVICNCEEKCISSIRNAGAKMANGKILVTIDADSCMMPNALQEIQQMLKSGKYIGGGAIPQFDRVSLGIACCSLYVGICLLPTVLKNKGFLSGAMFWCCKRAFDAIGGFDESLVSLEDMDFAVRLRNYGKRAGKKFGTLRKTRVITSARKFDRFGDWYLIKNRTLTRAIFTGKDRKAADSFYYDIR